MICVIYAEIIWQYKTYYKKIDFFWANYYYETCATITIISHPILAYILPVNKLNKWTHIYILFELYKLFNTHLILWSCLSISICLLLLKFKKNTHTVFESIWIFHFFPLFLLLQMLFSERPKMFVPINCLHFLHIHTQVLVYIYIYI